MRVCTRPVSLLATHALPNTKKISGRVQNIHDRARRHMDVSTIKMYNLDTVHRRLVELLAVADSCLDTTVALLTREHEVWQAPADAPSRAFSSQPTERPRPLRLPMGECLDWVIHGTCGRQERCPQRLTHLIARIGNGNLPRTTERSSSTCAKRPKRIPLHG